MHKVFLLLGSNLGDRYLFIQQAIIYIEAQIAPVIEASMVYETQSWGISDAPDYLNRVIILQTEISPKTILQHILHIENIMGRQREKKWGPRIIDIDILFYGQEIINEPGLHIPHPELHKRMFTLVPLAEIAPYWEHPVLKANILTLKNNLIDGLNVKRYNLEIDKPFMTQNALPLDLDLSFLFDIAEGSSEFIVESIDMFLQQSPELLKMINTGLKAGDWATVAAAAHKLKPNCGFFGMTVCQAMIQEVEIMAKNGAPDPELLKSKFQEVEMILNENLIHLETIRAEKEAGI